MNFLWNVDIRAELKSEFQAVLTETVNEKVEFTPCHANEPTVHILASDPLEHTVTGQICCSCGTPILEFFGASDGSRLTFNTMHANISEE
jgi:hypothetical protein